MIRSMTAFARKENRSDLGTLIWELRSVNHRYTEMFFRLPEELRSEEGTFREHANASLGRGKLEAVLTFRPDPATVKQLEVNLTLATAVVEATHELEAIMNNPSRIGALDVLRWPGVAVEPEPDTAQLMASATTLFKQALRDLIAGREREGERLKALIEQRCAALETLTNKLRARRPEVLKAVREKLVARIAEIATVEADPGRLEQELAYIAQKLDVDEELDRMDSHCKEVYAALARDEPVGRRLDFLMQELNREVNTLGSKSADVETTQAVVEAKVLIEQMREQVQNIE